MFSRPSPSMRLRSIEQPFLGNWVTLRVHLMRLTQAETALQLPRPFLCTLSHQWRTSLPTFRPTSSWRHKWLVVTQPWQLVITHLAKRQTNYKHLALQASKRWWAVVFITISHPRSSLSHFSFQREVSFKHLQYLMSKASSQFCQYY